jgi:O-antigen ligase
MKNPVFIIVCLLIALTPLMRGSVHAWAETVIQILVVLGLILVVAKSLKRGKRNKKDRSDDSRNSLESDAVSEVRDGLAPNLTLWWWAGPVAALGVWSTVMSPHPALALQGLIMLVTYLGFFWLVVVSVKSRKEQRALVWVVVGTAVFLGVVGLLERYDILTFAWWNYSVELGEKNVPNRLSGVYANPNHMAGFLEMAIPMMLGMFLTRSWTPEARIGMIAMALFLIVCQALTLSRGGWAGTAVALFFMALVLLFKKGFVHKRLVATLLVTVIVTALIVMASTPVVQTITTLTQRKIEDSLTGRLTYWAGTRAMIADNLAAGTGPGTFTVAFPPYQVPGLAVLPRYAHSDYLQLPAEAGILTIPVVLWLLYWFFRIGFTRLKSRSRQTMGITLGTMAAVVAILIHSYSDGNLQIPANTLLFTALIAAGLRNLR